METRLVLFSGFALNIALFLPLAVRGSEYTTIVCPDTESSEATGINASEQIVGYCGKGPVKGFVRLPNGVLTTFTAPHATYETIALDINDSGAVTGFYAKSGDTGEHGFIRSAEGGISDFDVPGSTSTFPASINSQGVIVGTYYIGTAVQGFMRDALGNFTTIMVPGSTYTQPTGVNTSGEVTGFEEDATGAHGFVQDVQGNITIFDVPGSDPEPTNGAQRGTVVEAINSSGEVTGWWSDAGNIRHGFTMDAQGNFFTFDAQGVGSYPYNGTQAVSINDSGEVAGSAINSDEHSFGFTQSGSNVPVNFYGPVGGPNDGYGPEVAKINVNGKIVGSYTDSYGHGRGFFRDVLPPSN
jgi:hypothetical protein